MSSKNTEGTNFQKYLDLIRGFLSNEITASVFETRFLQLRREDSQCMKFGSDHKAYRILDTLKYTSLNIEMTKMDK
ncbi:MULTISPECIES: colicin immunity domain-containing protein [Sphingobacterium]|uniref:colicin immunity domain-containing protein n=1 Tax=Sphingobacterium TaxID=28453 RepID=UPI002580043B|nr:MULTISPECIES: colicin immunity domain-containing protein [Sphingobacterium]